MLRTLVLLSTVLSFSSASPAALLAQRYPGEAGMRVLETAGLSDVVGMRPDQLSEQYAVVRFSDGSASLDIEGLGVEVQFDSILVGPAMSIRLSEESKVTRVVLIFDRSDVEPMLETLIDLVGRSPDECYTAGGRFIRQVTHRWEEEGILLVRHEEGYEGGTIETELRVFVAPPRRVGRLSNADPC